MEAIERRELGRLRRCILETLYDFFREYPYAEMDPRQLTSACGTDPRQLNWNLVYLEKHGWVALGKGVECPPFVACSATITANGIDLVEDQPRFHERFPAGPEDTEYPETGGSSLDGTDG